MAKSKSSEVVKPTGVVKFYSVHADRWITARSEEATLYERPWMDKFAALLPRHGSVLDIGCGSGEPLGIYLHKAGFAVTGLDVTPRMAELFQANLPGHEVVVADMRELALERKFNGLLAWDSFFHLNRDDQTAMFQRFETHALPGGVLMFTSGTSNGEDCGRLFGDSLFHASLAPDEYRILLKTHGFDLVENVFNDPQCRGRSVWLARKKILI